MRASDAHIRADFETGTMNGNGLPGLGLHDGHGGRRPDLPGMSVELEPGATAAGEARAALSALDGRIDSNVLDDVRLLVSELVTNSVRHAGAERELVRLMVTSNGTGVRVEVSDGGVGFQPTARSKAHDEVGGWGLHLVDRLADRWGVETGRRTRVWFEISKN